MSENYHRLRRLAKHIADSSSESVHATMLVHEAYAKLRKSKTPLDLSEKRKFIALVTRTMRSIVVDHHRAKNTDKRTPPGEQVLLDSIRDQLAASCGDPQEVKRALQELERAYPICAEIVDCHFFGQMPFKEIAALHGRDVAWVRTEWSFARAFLLRELK